MSHMNRWTHHRWCACSKIELNVSWLLGTRCETTAQVSWLPAPAIKLLMPIPFAVAELTASSLCLTQVWSLSLSSAWSVWLFLISVGGGGRWLSKMITLCHPLKLTTHMLSHVIFSYHPFWLQHDNPMISSFIPFSNSNSNRFLPDLWSGKNHLKVSLWR